MTRPEYKEVDYPTFLLIKKHLKTVKEMDITISGKSMYPLYKGDSHLNRVSCLESVGELRRFDVIVFWQNNILISHYFWKVNEHFNEDPDDPYIVTRPLNPLKTFDHPIKKEQILGLLPERLSFWLKLRVFLANL